MRCQTKVTVGFCVKNAEQTVEESLRCILNQDYPHELIKLIVVDGCSKDKTLPIIRKTLANADIEYQIFRENYGLGFARQIVVENAVGEYVIWIDADIIVPKNFVRKQVEFMGQNPCVAIGRAIYGILPDSGLIAFLENIPFVVECLKLPRNVPLGISGTEGAIYRLEAVKQAGGFDINIKGAGEDIDLAERIRKFGWSAYLTNAVFYEKCRNTWKSLFDEYFWWGYGGYYRFCKTKNLLELLKMTPLAGFVAGLLRFPIAYRLTRKKSLFLLPFHYAFKRTAWFCGFIKGHINGYI
jgi:glycosyltransferase involved in cell wall biosynthesis